MKISRPVLLFISLFVPSVITASEVPFGENDFVERELQAFGQQCSEQKSLCEKVTGNVAVPVDRWLKFLDKLDGNDQNTLVDNIKEIVKRAQAAQFSPAVNSIRGNDEVQKVLKQLRSVVTEVAESKGLDPDATVQALYGAIEATDKFLKIAFNIGATPIQLEAVKYILAVVSGLIKVSDNGSQEIVTFVLKAVVQFVKTFASAVVTVQVFPNADSKCVSDVLLCEYIRMLLNVVPGLMATVFINSESAMESDVPSMVPSDVPSIVPSDMPSIVPSDAPSRVPSDAPSRVPSTA